MKNNNTINNKLINDFEANKEFVFQDVSNEVKNLRLENFKLFSSQGLPNEKDENWLKTDVCKVIDTNYIQHFNKTSVEFEPEDIFSCDVPELNTITVKTINGWFPRSAPQLQKLDNGIIIGSFAEALKQYPELVLPHYAKIAKNDNNSLTALNTACATDGVFIYVPDNVCIEKPLQIINIIYSTDNLFAQQRNLFIAGKNSSAEIVVCDHSLYFNKSFVNSVSEVVIKENANLQIYQLQNFNNETAHNSTFAYLQDKKTVLTSNIITMHGGFVRNNTNVQMNGEYCESNLFGLYMADMQQHIDNHTFIDHAFPNCRSNEKYKGIIDHKAKALFSGRVLVRENAQITDASQSNNNILLSDDAKAYSKPQLEIYADDVKCSHGATVGQLDENALFYLRARGINEKEARLMLMFAYASEIINEIKVKPLRERIDDMIHKRLRGELSRCNHCAIKCS